MSELFKIHILSSNIRTCFFYVNDSDLGYYERHGCAIKIKYGINLQNLTYGCISLTSLSEVPSKCIGVASLYANILNLNEGEVVLLSNCSVDSICSLQILPEKEEDYVILLSCKSLLEAYLLNQVSVVAEGQILPLYVFSNISIKVEIGKLNLETGYGRLEKLTEITVLHPSEKIKKIPNISEHEINLQDELKKGRGNFTNYVCNQLNEILKSRINISQINEQKNAEAFLKHLTEENLLRNVEFKIQPSFFCYDKTFKCIQNRFIIVSNLNCAIDAFGPYCLKILAKVEKVTNDAKEKAENDHENKKENFALYTYVISLNNYEGNVAFCPSEVMKKLKLFVGSKITVEHIKPNPKLELSKCSGKINCDNEDSECFWSTIGAMRENVRLIIINNFKYNFKINTLIVGGPGMGKTFFLNDILNWFSKEFIFCKILHCKSLRGKKIETLHKLWLENLRECALYEPSILILDDLHALTYIDEEEGQYNRLYSNRVVDLMSNVLKNFQGKYNISVIASAVNMSRLASLVTRYGPRLFQAVLTIPVMNFEERNFALKCIINSKTEVTKARLLDFSKLSGLTNGYTIQDLNDMVDKAVFNCLLRNETDNDVINVTQLDFDLALSESTPLNLRGVKLKQNISIKWENVGGMVEPKKILTEVFSWPLKYPYILETSPLRLQRGVLLYGAPGTGKTLLAGALANKCGLNFISVKGPEVLSKYVGASEEGVRNLFLQAQKTQPCLLFFDEFDSLAPKRGHDNTGVTDRVVNQLLTQLDGVESSNGVWVLAATSRPDLLDSALLRPGRLDKLVFCDLPNQVDRLSILKVFAQNVSNAEDVNLLEIAKKSEGYTGADLRAIFCNAQMLAIKEEKSSLGNKSVIKIKQIHFSKALSEVKPSLSPREQMRYKNIYEKFLNSRKGNIVESYGGMQRVTLA